MSWLKTVLLNLRTAFSAAPKPGGPRSIEAAIRTAARKTLAQEPSKLMNSPKRLTTSPRPPNAPKTPEELAWQRFLEEPSPHQRLAPYA
ncbi:hypothetical protein SLS57_002458 [Botryosphaeria dothidea]